LVRGLRSSDLVELVLGPFRRHGRDHRTFAPLGRIGDQTRAAVIALRIGRVSATAAKRSADTAEKSIIDLERPWVFVRISQSEGFSLTPPAQDEEMWVAIDYTVENFGRSPAFVFEAAVQFRVVFTPIPDKPNYGSSGTGRSYSDATRRIPNPIEYAGRYRPMNMQRSKG